LPKALWMAALAPLLAAAVLPTQIQTLVCRWGGVAMAADSCCPSPPEESRQIQAALRGETCCLVKTVELPKLLSEPTRNLDRSCRPELAWSTPWSRAWPILAGDLFAGVGDLRSVGPPVDSPSLGPPIVLRKRAFLI
jgi:hypothetical protein